jgi:uncharacterized protein
MNTVAVYVTGVFSSGKTEFIRAVSETPVVSQVGLVSSTPQYGDVAFDYGQIQIDEDTLLYLFGQPGAIRFHPEWMVNDLAQGMAITPLPVVIMVDSSRCETFREAKSMLEMVLTYFDMPVVVAANKQDKPNAWDVDAVRVALSVPSDVPVLPCMTRQRETVRQILVTLFELYLREYEAP